MREFWTAVGIIAAIILAGMIIAGCYGVGLFGGLALVVAKIRQNADRKLKAGEIRLIPQTGRPEDPLESRIKALEEELERLRKA